MNKYKKAIISIGIISSMFGLSVEMDANISNSYQAVAVVKTERTVPLRTSKVIAENSSSATLSIVIEGAKDSVVAVISPDGEHISNFDANGNLTIEFTVDKNGVYPFTAIYQNGENEVVWIQVTELLSSGVSEIDKIEYRLSGATENDWSLYDSTLTLEREGITKIEARATDRAGNTGETSAKSAAIDKTPPIFSATKLMDEDKQSLTIHGFAIDAHAQVKSIQQPDGSLIHGNQSTFTVFEDGIYPFSVTDFAGNTSMHWVTVDEFGIGGVSGVHKIEYQLTGATTKDWSEYTDVFSISNEGKTVIRARAIDRAGNVSAECEKFVQIDKQSPINGGIIINLKQ